MSAPAADADLGKRSDSLTDLALTLPIFVVYHLGVVFLPVRNAADPVSGHLADLAHESLVTYLGITVAIGVAFVLLLLALGQRKSLKSSRFLMIAGEGALYAFIMRAAGSYATSALALASPVAGHALAQTTAVPDVAGTSLGSVVMALGAGFYEEVLFRAGLFGVGALLVKKLAGSSTKTFVILACWALVEAAIFSGWHYVGALGDGFSIQSFVFRAVCGLVLTAIFAFRGFAPAVWTHALYDLWVMV
jgi:Type II CAAX prenyl endopeptidase Rce1-like